MEALYFSKTGANGFLAEALLAEYMDNDNAPFQLIPNEYTGEQSITFDRVFNMNEDRQHNVWIATDNGVFVFNPDMQFFNNYKLSAQQIHRASLRMQLHKPAN